MKIPKHVAVIMDGNGRWAQARGRPRVYGHVRGVKKIRPLVEYANEVGIKVLTFFAFSTENWHRPSSERSILWRLLIKYLKREVSRLKAQGVQLNVLGEIERLSDDVKSVLMPSIEELKGNSRLILNFAVSYGSRKELVRAAKLFAQQCQRGVVNPDELNEENFEQFLWTSFLGKESDVDLVIRTSGEVRLSNFMLWQAAYAEYWFSKVLWPDFSPSDFQDAIHAFSQRSRRYGKINQA